MTPEQTAEKILEPFEIFDGYLSVAVSIAAAIWAEHLRITELAEAIEQGTYTTSRTVAQVLRAEREACFLHHLTSGE